MKQLFGIRKRAKPIIEDRQGDHHEHRRQNESCQGSAGAAPSAQAKSDVGDCVSGAGARQALTQGQGFDEVLLAEPTPLEHYDMSDLREHGEAAAKSGKSDFQE